jgi:NAD(P)H-hydrate epimerase
MAGAAALTAGAALRCGAGLVYVSADEELWPVIQTREPCAVCVGRPCEKIIQEKDFSQTEAKPGRAARPDFRSDPGFSGYDALAAGPGIGTGPAAEALVSLILRDYGGPLVLDADALNIIAGGSGAAKPIRAGMASRETVITPHPGEAARLLDVGAADIQADRRGAAALLAKKYGAVVALKGRGTIVAAPPAHSGSGRAPAIFENTTGNPGMATAGSGDALTGVIASFAAQGMSALDAAVAGAFIHGLAGDIAAEARGEYGLVATDIVDALPRAIMRATRAGETCRRRL